MTKAACHSVCISKNCTGQFYEGPVTLNHCRPMWAEPEIVDTSIIRTLVLSVDVDPNPKQQQCWNLKHTKSQGSRSLRGFLRSKLITVLDGLFKNGNFIERIRCVGNRSLSFSALLSYASTSDKFLSTTSSNSSSSSSSLELSPKQKKNY